MRVRVRVRVPFQLLHRHGQGDSLSLQTLEFYAASHSYTPLRNVRVHNNTLITCSNKKRDYSSDSGPLVRYIPKKSIRNPSFQFSEPSPPLDTQVQCGGNPVQRRSDFDSETRMCSTNSDHDGVEQDDGIQESGELEELSVHQQCFNQRDRNVFQAHPFENKTNITSEKLRVNFDSTSHDEQKISTFDAKPQYQDTIMEECEEVFEDDDNLEEREDELDDELTEESSSPRRNRYGKQYVVNTGGNKTKYDAEKAAVKLLATRAFTTVELKKKLCGKGHSASVVDSVISDFQSRGLLNDSWFAEAFCQSRWSSSTWGPRRIKQELSRKGVSKVDTENAIDAVFRDEESELSHGLSKTSMDTLFTQASKQWLRGRDAPKETRKSRIIRWLLYRGFSWDVIGSIVKRLESSQPP